MKYAKGQPFPLCAHFTYQMQKSA